MSKLFTKEWQGMEISLGDRIISISYAVWEIPANATSPVAIAVLVHVLMVTDVNAFW